VQNVQNVLDSVEPNQREADEDSVGGEANNFSTEKSTIEHPDQPSWLNTKEGKLTHANDAELVDSNSSVETSSTELPPDLQGPGVIADQEASPSTESLNLPDGVESKPDIVDDPTVVERQADFVESQAGIVKSQAGIVESQADVVEGPADVVESQGESVPKTPADVVVESQGESVPKTPADVVVESQAKVFESQAEGVERQAVVVDGQGDVVESQGFLSSWFGSGSSDDTVTAQLAYVVHETPVAMNAAAAEVDGSGQPATGAQSPVSSDAEDAAAASVNLTNEPGDSSLQGSLPRFADRRATWTTGLLPASTLARHLA
jgi:hypothetical protein